MIYLHVKDLRVGVLNMLGWRLSYSCLFIGKLNTTNQKLADHIARNKPKLIAVYMNRLNLINSQIGVGFIKNFAIGATCHDFHSEAKEYEVIAYVKQGLL
jgi:hypothetical protein